MAIGGAIGLAGCHRNVSMPAPPRVTAPISFPKESSTVIVPVSASLDDLERAVEKELPRQLWTIDQQVERCVPAQRVNLGIGRVKLTPDLGCRIVGQVVRGPVTLGGSGSRLTIAMPVHATIAARKVGGVLSKTATGSAIVHAVANLSIRPDWIPSARVSIDYDWTEPPGIDFAGQRIVFVDKADQRLQPVVAKLEKTLPQQLAALRLDRQLADVWRRAFTAVSLNRDNPPVWMRIAPQRLGFGGYRIEEGRLTMMLSADALTQTFVGKRPTDPPATPLPPPSRVTGTPGLRFFIPVVADYAQLEPVVKRALEKRAAKGITLTGVGPVDARFGKVTVYATTNDHLAVGIQANVKAQGTSLLSTRGEVWLTAIPFNRPGSQRVEVRDLSLTTHTDSSVTDLLVALFNDAGVQESIRGGLSHDFAPDYAKVLDSARRAIGSRREGDFLLATQVDRVENGVIKATGQGLFMPVRVSGRATITYRPL
ncbi:DUF4403 family protein [Sphingomonas gellani]|uniref:DUF4403 family protein n=1 Tax=Sphingomonas gellani TaxID=1166340 RepID=UPI001FCDFE7B|nr:DUF4403 family protein [Sphingomonas gellani]